MQNRGAPRPPTENPNVSPLPPESPRCVLTPRMLD